MGFTGIGKGVGGTGDGTIDSTTTVRASSNYNASVGEHVVMSGGNVVNLPDPKQDGFVMVSKYDDTGLIPEIQDPRTNETIEGQDRVSPSVEYPVVFLSDASSWYVSDASDTTLTIPDSGGTHQWNWSEGSGNTLSDSIGSLTGTRSGPEWDNSAGVGGYHLDFVSGNNDSVTLPSGATSEFTHFTNSGKGTFFIWIDPDDTSSRNQIWGVRWNNGTLGAATRIESGTLSFAIWGGDGTTEALASGAVSSSAGWTPVAATADGSTLTLYIGDSNNNLQQTDSASISGTNSGDWGDVPQWGLDPNYGRPFDGGMDIPWTDNVSRSQNDLQQFVDDTAGFY